MSFTNFCISLVLFLFFSINSNTTRMIFIIIEIIIIIILNPDIPATRPVDPVCESLDDVVDELIIIVNGGDLSLSYSTLLIVKTPYT